MPDTVDNKSQRMRQKKLMLVRYGRMHHLGMFEHNENQIPSIGIHVVVKTAKGLELGAIVGPLTCYRAGRFRLDTNQVNDYYKVSEVDMTCEVAGKFIRYASQDDLNEEQHLRRIEKDEIKNCQGIADEMNLNMKVVDAEHILGGERIIFFFMADGRVDFRELVKRLSHEFQTRIEMRQIGARDEAKLLGDVESCGQECCCRRFLKFLKPVNMRMAKMQKATLDPSKISGYCGRLKCCLRYEDQTYAELKKRLPKKNARVRTPKAEGRVVDVHLLTQLVVVEYEEGIREALPVEDIHLFADAKQQQREGKSSSSGRNNNHKNQRRHSEKTQQHDNNQNHDNGETQDEKDT